jgi:hypothetical protein
MVPKFKVRESTPFVPDLVISSPFIPLPEGEIDPTSLGDYNSR